MKKIVNLRQLFKGFLVFILFYFSSLFQLIPIYIFSIDSKNISGSTGVMLSCFSTIVLCVLLFLIYRKELIDEWKIFKNNFINNMDTGFKYWLIGLIIMMVSNIFINFIIGKGQAANEQAVQKMISYLPWLMVFNAGILAPISEEITFRKCFKNAFPNKWIFVILSGLVFGSLHVITSLSTVSDLLYIIPYSSLGCAFAYIYYKTDTIFTSISMHAIHNTVLTILSIIAL